MHDDDDIAPSTGAVPPPSSKKYPSSLRNQKKRMKKIVSLFEIDEEAGENLKISSWDNTNSSSAGRVAVVGGEVVSCPCCEMKEVSSLDGLGLCAWCA